MDSISLFRMLSPCENDIRGSQGPKITPPGVAYIAFMTRKTPAKLIFGPLGSLGSGPDGPVFYFRRNGGGATRNGQGVCDSL